ncbi:MAG TPA: ABC transporter ATP-binding protein [Thermoanaerobaculia bacterium]|nr:ABC transporter ATP-binding protein [Thermoanaerobaculia bacterium]
MFLEARGIGKSFGGEDVLRGVDLSVAQQTTLSILGRSGCGKTTLLKIVAGLIAPDAGQVLLRGIDITNLPPQRRHILYLYQEPLLFPHLDAFDNVAFGLRLRDRPEPEVREATETMLAELDLSEQRHKMPHQLSGGQRQRVAFGRALAINPALLLLDEPFSSLDSETRGSMQQLFKRIAARHAITSIFVTHNLKESILMGDAIAHMRDGALHTYATKEAFVQDPGSGVAEEMEFWDGLRFQ